MISEINIFGKIYKIDNTEVRPLDCRTDHVGQTIYISDGLSKESQNCVLLGELISILSLKLDLELCGKQISGLREGLFSAGVGVIEEGSVSEKIPCSKIPEVLNSSTIRSRNYDDVGEPYLNLEWENKNGKD